MAQILPLESTPNQTFQIVLAVDGKNLAVEFFLKYSEIAECWLMKVTNLKTSIVLLDSIPLVASSENAINLLAAYSYLGIGSAFLVNVGNVSAEPTLEDLGTNFVLVWGDTE